MQFFSKKAFTTIIIGISTAALAVVLRVLLMKFGFDYQSLFFDNNTLPTALYIFVLLSALFVLVFSKKVNTFNPINQKADFVLNILCMIAFVVLFFVKLSDSLPEMYILRLTHWGAVISSVASVVFYLLSAVFQNKKTPALPYLNIAPVIYLLCISIDCFTSISVKANSYYLFPHIVSIIFLAFYIINNAKRNNCVYEKGIPTFSYSIMTMQILAFSVIPDVILIILSDAYFTDPAITILKLTYLVRVAFEIHANKEDKQ